LDRTAPRGGLEGVVVILELTRSNFDRETSGGNVVVLFYSGGRGLDPRAMLAPVAGHQLYAEEIRVAMLDVDRHPEIAKRYGAVVFPAALILRNGIVKKMIQMVHDPERIIEAVKENARCRSRVTVMRTEQRNVRKSRRGL